MSTTPTTAERIAREAATMIHGYVSAYASQIIGRRDFEDKMTVEFMAAIRKATTKLERERQQVLKALQAAHLALFGLRGQCDEREWKESFPHEAKALPLVEKALAMLEPSREGKCHEV